MFAMWDRRECSCWIIIATQRCTSERNIWWVVDEVGSLTDYPWRNYMKRCLRMYDAFIICVLNLNQFCMKFRKQFCEKPESPVSLAQLRNPLASSVRSGDLSTYLSITGFASKKNPKGTDQAIFFLLMIIREPSSLLVLPGLSGIFTGWFVLQTVTKPSPETPCVSKRTVMCDSNSVAWSWLMSLVWAGVLGALIGSDWMFMCSATKCKFSCSNRGLVLKV